MSNVVFPPEFLEKLKKLLNDLVEFAKTNWFLGAIFVVIVAILIVLQQIFFIIFSGAF